MSFIQRRRGVSVVLAWVLLTTGCGALDDVGKLANRLGTTSDDLGPHLDEAIRAGAPTQTRDDVAKSALQRLETAGQAYADVPGDLREGACEALSTWLQGRFNKDLGMQLAGVSQLKELDLSPHPTLNGDVQGLNFSQPAAATTFDLWVIVEGLCPVASVP